MENNRALEHINTPSYVCYEELLENNLKILKYLKEQSGVKILLALKGFAFSPLLELVNKYLDGYCASGLHEVLYSQDNNAKQIHTFSPAFKKEEFDEICKLSNHIVFNSISNYTSLKNMIQKHNSVGIRINPELSTTSCSMYDPCSSYSRLGITYENLQKAIKEDEGVLNNIDGFHFHALCEQNSSDLEKVLKKFENNFSKYFKNLKWINFGGGHHITRDDYDVDLLINLIKKFNEKYPHIQVYLEPSEAIGWKTGVLVTSVLDIVNNEINIAILDTSAEAHMPDTLLMPYKADVKYASKNKKEKKYMYRLAGNTCLAGDIMGDYSFDEPLKIGQKIIFEDMIHYSIVKNTTFNGIKLPSLAVVNKQNELKIIKEFTYEEYKRRN